MLGERFVDRRHERTWQAWMGAKDFADAFT
jgi:hypothetical protein